MEEQDFQNGRIGTSPPLGGTEADGWESATITFNRVNQSCPASLSTQSPFRLDKLMILGYSYGRKC